MSRRLGRPFFARPVLEVAPELLNKVLVTPVGAGRIIEVEAYGGFDDPGSHAHRGPTPRSQVMFGRAGHLYVYLSYGVHWCANVVVGPEGEAGAVLVRAVRPLRGIEAMRARRAAARRDLDLANGPGKLTQALAIDGTHDGIDLVAGDRGVSLRNDGTSPPAVPVQDVRVGLTRGAELPWRWYVPGEPGVSRPR